MSETKRVIFFSNRAETIRPMVDALRAASYEVRLVDQAPDLIREARSARDRVVLMDFSSHNVCGLELLREIKYLDGSIQIVVVNAEPRVYEGILIFRSGAEACFFAPELPMDEVVVALDAAFAKVARWWKCLQGTAAHRPAGDTRGVRTREGNGDGISQDRLPTLDEEVALVLRSSRLKGLVVKVDPEEGEVLVRETVAPAPLEKVFVRFRGGVIRAVVHRWASDPEGGVRISLDWSIPAVRIPALAGARSERAMFVTLDGWRVVARSLAAVDKDLVSARLATGDTHAVPMNSIRSMSRSERETELLAAPDPSPLAKLYRLGSPMDRKATVQAIMAIEFAIEEPVL